VLFRSNDQQSSQTGVVGQRPQRAHTLGVDKAWGVGWCSSMPPILANLGRFVGAAAPLALGL
jgi:hypothetical protein